jgi:hypothetical protein
MKHTFTLKQPINIYQPKIWHNWLSYQLPCTSLQKIPAPRACKLNTIQRESSNRTLHRLWSWTAAPSPGFLSPAYTANETHTSQTTSIIFSQNPIRFQQFAHRIIPLRSQIQQRKQQIREWLPHKPIQNNKKKSQKRGWIEARYNRNRDGWRRLTILDRVAGRRKRRPAEEGKGARGEARPGVPRRSFEPLRSLACLGSLLVFFISLSLPECWLTASVTVAWRGVAYPRMYTNENHRRMEEWPRCPSGRRMFIEFGGF